MPSTWTRLQGKHNTGLYRNEVGTVRCVYMERIWRDGHSVSVQRAKSFPKALHPDNLKAARAYKAQRDYERVHENKVHDLALEKMTLGDFYVQWLKDKPRRAATLSSIDRAWRVHIAPTFAEAPVRAINVPMVRGWYRNLNAGDGAKSKALVTLRSILRAAEDEGLRDGLPDPTRKLTATHRVAAITRDKVFTDEQLARLGEALPDRDRLLLDLLAAGLRIGEATALQRKHVNLRGDVTVERTMTEVNGRLIVGPPKSKNGYRTLPRALDPLRLNNHLYHYCGDSDDALLITAARGGPLHPSLWRKRSWYPALEKAGLPRIPPHALRHVCACRLAADNVSAIAIAGWLGDSVQVVTSTYINILDSGNERIGEMLAARREEVMT